MVHLIARADVDPFQRLGERKRLIQPDRQAGLPQRADEQQAVAQEEIAELI
jgi:hypothetical protein